MHRRNQSRRPGRSRSRNKHNRFRVVLTLIILAPIVAAGTLGGTMLYRWSRELPDVEQLASYRPSQTTKIYSSDGILLTRLFDENRIVVPLSRISPDLIHATIAIEDHRFYQHRGVDWRGTARALVENVRNRDYGQGGSTITQQLVRNVFLTPEKRVERKAKEAMMALEVEKRFSKDQILHMYLNQVYYGERSFGVEAASRRYFGKPARDLRLAEAALLAGLPQRPTAYNPYRDKEAATRRRNLVLRRMAETGYITPERAKKASWQALDLAYQKAPRLTARRAPYFVDYVVQTLEDRYGAEKVYRGGLRVQTTLNTKVQRAAEQAVVWHMNARFGTKRTQAALVAVDPVTGYVRAMVGGRDYGRSVFNRAVQAKRQPGSSFKPFVYAAALNAGLSPFDRITDEPIKFEMVDGELWKPKNYDGRWHGQMNLVRALANSVNIPAVKLLDTVGPSAVIRMAKSCGVTSPLHEHLSLALGTSEVTVLEMASAYGTFAAGGIHTDPIAIVNIKDSQGHTLEANYPLPDVVLDPVIARRMDFMLRQVVVSGTGRRAGVVPHARGKTGTTNDLKDAWFVGYTPSLSTAVWVGNDTPSKIPNLTGGGACAPIWSSFMERALDILPKRPMPHPLRMPKPVKPTEKVYVAEEPALRKEPSYEPDYAAADIDPVTYEESYGYADIALDPDLDQPVDVVRQRVCLITGQRAGANCPDVDTVAFVRGTEPAGKCTLHTGRARKTSRSYNVVASDRGDIALVCRDSGGLAGPGCRDLTTVLLEPGAKEPAPCKTHARRAMADDQADRMAYAGVYDR